MNEIRMAVIGVGRIGLIHAENMAHRVRGARLVAVTTSQAERAAAARRHCGPVAVYPTLDALLDAEHLDAVTITSSTAAHVGNVERCAAAGLHVFCEKPLALTLPDCDRAIAATDKAGVKLMVGHVRQFDKAHAEARRFIEAGAIGRPIVFRAVSGDTDPPPASFADPAVSGGLVLDAMYHDLYLARWLMADEVIRAYAEGDALVDEGVRSVGDVDNAVVSLRFAGGALGTLVVSRTTRYAYDLRVEVVGDEGAVQIGRLEQTPMRLLDRQGIHRDTVRTFVERFDEAFLAELQAFVDCIVQDTVPPVTGRDSRATVAVGLAATRSLHEGQPTRVSDTR